jgi:hypothetical protein
MVPISRDINEVMVSNLLRMISSRRYTSPNPKWVSVFPDDHLSSNSFVTGYLDQTVNTSIKDGQNGDV